MFEQRPLREAIGAQLGGGTPPRAIASYWGGSIPWASVKDFTDDGATLASTVESITPEGLRASSSNLIPSGTPLVCTRMAVGRSALAPMPVAINQDVKALVPADGVCGPYLLRLLQYIQPAAASAAIGSTVKGIRIQDYLSLSVPLAPQIEQGAIVEVLNTLDTTIRQTEAIIAKLKQVKQGLLHDLLTRGIDANGELRPPQSEAPHLYKASPLGWIPADWQASDVVSEFDVTSGLTLGPHRTPKFRPRKYLRVANVQRTRIDLADVAQLDATDAEIMTRQLLPGDLLVVEGHASTNEIGRCAMAGEAVRGYTFQNHLFRLRAIRMDATFALHWLNSAFVRSYWSVEAATSSGLNTINRTKLDRLSVAVPSLSEQQKIVAVVGGIELRVDLEEQQLAKLKAQKSGLMDDLITGRVRVTPLLQEHGQSSTEGTA